MPTPRRAFVPCILNFIRLSNLFGEITTPQGLADYLESYLKDQETDYYSKRNYRKLTDVEHIVQDPSTINSMATTIVQVGYEIPIKPGPNIPKGLTATTYAALLHFQDKGNVIFRANNFERHSPPLSYPTLLSSIEYKPEVPMFRGPDPITLSGFAGMSTLLDSGGDVQKAKIAMARAQSRPGSDCKPECCLNCGADSQPNGQELLSCGRCKTATFVNVVVLPVIGNDTKRRNVPKVQRVMECGRGNKREKVYYSIEVYRVSTVQ